MDGLFEGELAEEVACSLEEFGVIFWNIVSLLLVWYERVVPLWLHLVRRLLGRATFGQSVLDLWMLFLCTWLQSPIGMRVDEGLGIEDAKY